MATEYNFSNLVFTTVSAASGFSEYLGKAKITSTNTTKYSMTGLKTGDIVRIEGEGNRLEQYVGPTNTDNFWLSGFASYDTTVVNMQLLRTTNFSCGQFIYSTLSGEYTMEFDNSTEDYSGLSWNVYNVNYSGSSGIWKLKDIDGNVIAINGPDIESSGFFTGWVSPLMIENYPSIYGGNVNTVLFAWANNNVGYLFCNVQKISLPSQYSEDNWHILRNTFELYINATTSYRDIWVVGLDGVVYTITSGNETYLGWVNQPFRMYSGASYDYNMSGVIVFGAYAGPSPNFDYTHSINGGYGCESDLFMNIYNFPKRGYLSLNVGTN